MVKEQQKQSGNLVAIIMMILLFGMISFVTNLAAPMGIVLKNQFGVSNAMGMLGNMANFIAYAVMGIPSGLLLQKVGFKKTALIAIAVGFVGVFIQFLSGHASATSAFVIYLLGAFVAGFSMCLLNTVVNPMLNTLGISQAKAKGKSDRDAENEGNQLIQIGGSFNSLLATFTPVFVGILIGGAIAQAEISKVFPVMYIAMGVFALIFFVLLAVSIPEPGIVQSSEPLGNLMRGALKFRHFILGAIAIFVYVGLEVGTPATYNLYMTGFTNEQAKEKVAEYQKQQNDPAYLAGLKAQDLANKKTPKYEVQEIKGNIYDSAQNIIEGKSKPGLGMNAGVAGGIVGFYWLLMLVGRLIGASIGKKVSAKKMLAVASSVGIILVLAAIFSSVTTTVKMPAFDTSSGSLSVGMPEVPITFLFLALVGLCTSIMWGGIFNLATAGLGKYIAAASGIFMVLVCGGGILPWIQANVADFAGYMISYWVIVIGLAYLLFYALIGSNNVNKDISVN